MTQSYPYYLAGRPVHANDDLEVLDKHTGRPAYRVAKADAEALQTAIAAADSARHEMAGLPGWRRREILMHCAERFRARFEELAGILIVEGGKVRRDAEGEITRLIDTFRVAAEEAVRIGGEVLPMDIAERTTGWCGLWRRVPLGPVALITPFNFPFNLVAHKVAPAIAAGCPFVLKPAARTPVSALVIGEVLAECGLPDGAFSILPLSRDEADPLIEDDRLKLLSFTGSDKVGWALKARAGKKRVTLELGGNAACLIDHDADLDDALDRVVTGAFYQAGQSCISVQRVLIHESLYERARDGLVARTRALKGGDPFDADTFVGPLIAPEEARRVVEWIDEAVSGGAKLLCGGRREGAIVQPAVLEQVDHSCRLWRDELFGPAMAIEPYADFDQALDVINDSRYGLQAGLFLRDIGKIRKAWGRLEVGGVVINDIPSFRIDHMPYGGVKDSGLGREGLRFAIEDMTEIRLLAIRPD